jgi:6-phosphofructokinase 2
VRTAAQELVRSGKARRVVVSLGPQGRWPSMKRRPFRLSTADEKPEHRGAGDSMVGAMALKLAQGASLLEMTRYGVAAGSAATINQGTRLCSLADTQKIVDYLSRN